jgi:hypothetical protein
MEGHTFRNAIQCTGVCKNTVHGKCRTEQVYVRFEKIQIFADVKT